MADQKQPVAKREPAVLIGTQRRTVGPVTTGSAAGTGVAGAAAVVLVWLLTLTGLDVPSEVSAAVAVLLGGVGTIVGGWLVRPREEPTVTEPGRHEAP